MMHAVDEGLRNVTSALRRTNRKTIVIFSTVRALAPEAVIGAAPLAFDRLNLIMFFVLFFTWARRTLSSPLWRRSVRPGQWRHRQLGWYELAAPRAEGHDVGR
jgi:hypothetical protein